MRRLTPDITARQSPAPWAWAAAGAVIGVLLAILINAPVHWLMTALQSATQGRVVLADARGTLWQGSAQLVLTGGAGSTDAATLPGRLSWQLHPTWSGLRADVQADCCMQQPWRLELQPRWGGARVLLADSLSQWPAQWLSGLGTPWNTIQAEGPLSLSTRSLVVEWVSGRLLLAGRVQVDANQIASRLSTIKPMGSYRVTVLGGATSTLQLETLEGSLQLSGQGQWVGGTLRFDGVASALPEHQDALANLLNIIGRREGAHAIIKVG